MALKDNLESEVETIFKEVWTERDGTVVPESDDLKLGNDAVKLDATVLYADISGSTTLVDDYKPTFAAEIYKAFLHCAAKIIRAEDGVITAYDGDRVMGVYIGDSKNTSAARSALKINHARIHIIINETLKKQYPKTTFRLQHTVGVDTSRLFIARTGIRGSNDLVWVGRAANYAAKLSALSPSYASYVTADVYNTMNKSQKVSSDGRAMWTRLTWPEMDDMTIYGSTWWRRV
jgi:class 3 adenylate cyclase